MEYWALRGFENLYLEDSWIVDVLAAPGVLTLRCDLVLRESHPYYATPADGEQYCYRRGCVTFANVKKLHWEDQTRVAEKDASGECDYGSFDRFIYSGDTYELIGDFGRIVVQSEPPSVGFS